jgi:hypothetical protein
VRGGERERSARPEDVVRLYDAALAAVAQLNELAAAVGGAAGEMLLDDCAAKVGRCVCWGGGGCARGGGCGLGGTGWALMHAAAACRAGAPCGRRVGGLHALRPRRDLQHPTSTFRGGAAAARHFRVVVAWHSAALPTPIAFCSQQAHYQAARCLYVAHSLLAAERYSEAAALYRRAADRCRQAASKYEDCARPDAAAGQQLEAAAAAAAAWGAVAAAQLRAGELREEGAAQAGLEGMSLEGEAAAGGVGTPQGERSSQGGRQAASSLAPRMPAVASIFPLSTAAPPPPPLACVPGKKRARSEEAFLEGEALDAWEPCVGPGKGQARIARCAGGGGRGLGMGCALLACTQPCDCLRGGPAFFLQAADA